MVKLVIDPSQRNSVIANQTGCITTHWLVCQQLDGQVARGEITGGDPEPRHADVLGVHLTDHLKVES